MEIKLQPRVILGVKKGYHTEVNGTTYNVIKHPEGGWKIINCSNGCYLPSVRTLQDAKESIASNEGF